MIGTTISHYRIVEKLGRGGMGVVYKAEDTKLDRTLALKFLPQDLSADEDTKQRFIREAKAASALDHPNICTIHDIGETGRGELFIVMAYYEGKTLGYRLDEEEFSIDRAVSVAIDLSRALERAHEAGIIHRDIKPANIMVTDRGEVKLLDFGLAKLTTGLDLTKEGSTLGTAAYMSPEQARSEDVDEGADIWALGVVLYEMLAGRKPFESAYDQALVYTILNEDPAPIQEIRSDVSADLAAVVARCLQKNRSARFSTMTEVRTALEGLNQAESTAGGRDGHADRTETPPQKPDRFSAKRMAAVLGAMAVLVVLFILTKGAGDERAPQAADNVIAVMPFSVRGSSDLAYLGEGMVDLLSDKLDGAGDLSSVNPRVVLALLKREGLTADDPDEARVAAAQLGAGRYVTGDVFQVGDRIRLTAYVNDLDSEDESMSRGTFEGSESELLDALDGITAELLSGMISEPSDQLTRTATTSSSLEAVKEYLLGEKALRQGLYRDASDAYHRAVEIDSTFALAWYRISIAADWTDAPDVRTSAEKALLFADHLSAKERSLLTALQIRRNGWADQAEAAYRNHLSRYLNDIEALTQFGEVLFHETSRKGRSTLESREPFNRVLELEPNNLIARIHLARLDGLEGDIEGLREHVRIFREEEGALSERAVEVDAMIAYATDDEKLQQQVIEQLRSSPFYFTFYAVHASIRYARNVFGAEQLLENRNSNDPLILWFIPSVSVLKGQFEAMEVFMASGEVPESPSWDLLEAFIRTTGVVPRDSVKMAAVADRITGSDLEETRVTGFIYPHDDITHDFLAFENAHHRALIFAQTGRLDEAEALLNEMRGSGEFVGMGSIREDAIIAVEAELALAREDAQGALDVLRQARYEIPHAASVRAIADGSRSRFLRAELEYAIGDRSVALNFYRGLDESWSPFDSFYRGPVYLRLAEIADMEGRSDDAILNYNRLLEMWSDADPELQETILMVQDRLAALLSSSAAEADSRP